MALGVFLGSLFGALTLGVPIAFALILSAVALMYLLGMVDSQIVAQNLIDGANSFSLMAIPFFILAGELMNAGGISRRVVDFAMALVGHIRGGLGYVVIIASVLFAGLSGSAVADTAALGAILIPMMTSRSYNKFRSTGLVAAAGIIAVVIPPSIPMILFGVTGSVSISKLFMGGIVPGILMATGLGVVWFIISGKSSESQRPKRKSLKEIWQVTKPTLWALTLPVVIIGGIRGGVFTPTEASVVAVFFALMIGMFVYKELKIGDLYNVFIAAAKTTSVVMLVAAAAIVAAWLITVAHVPQDMANLLSPFMDNKMLLMIVISVLLLAIGCVMDLTPAILIFTPVLLPLAEMAHIDPVYFGIVMIINLSIGLITPPVGTVLYVACGISKISIVEITRGIWPFLLVHITVLLLLIIFPQIVMVPLGWFT